MRKLGPCARGASPGLKQRIVDTETGPVGFQQGQGGQPPAGHLLKAVASRNQKSKGLTKSISLGRSQAQGYPCNSHHIPTPSSPALPPPGHSPPSHVQSHLSSHLRGKSVPHAVQAAVAASEKQLPGTCCLQDPVPALGFVIRVNQRSACRVDPILPATYGPVPPPLLAEVWPHSTKRALTKVISVLLCHQQWRHLSL